MFVVKPRWSGDCFSVNIVRKLVLAMCSSSLHIIGNTTIPLSAKPGRHRIAVDTVDLQQTTSLESATTSLTRQY
jgi:hypothetical protein